MYGITTLEETGASSQLVIVSRNKKEERENVRNKAKVYRFILTQLIKSAEFYKIESILRQLKLVPVVVE